MSTHIAFKAPVFTLAQDELLTMTIRGCAVEGSQQ